MIRVRNGTITKWNFFKFWWNYFALFPLFCSAQKTCVPKLSQLSYVYSATKMSCVIGEAISSFLVGSVTFSTEYVVDFELKIGNAFSRVYTPYIYCTSSCFNFLDIGKIILDRQKIYNVSSVLLCVHAILEKYFLLLLSNPDQSHFD